jgi:hypothetical protein
MTTNTKRAAENALWHALEERRDDIRAAGLWTGRSEQQHQGFGEAHAAARLIDELVAIMERRAMRAGGDPVQLTAMAQAIKHGFPIWEEVLIRPGELWTPYFKRPRVREGAERAIEAAKAWAKWH